MASTRNRIPNPSLAFNFDGENQSPKISLYEQSRDERIKKNLQRMQELGIMDLSLKLKDTSALHRRTTRTTSPNSRSPAPFPPAGSVRRSSRLKNTTPVSYSEVVLPEKEQGLKLEVGSRPEVYTEEHAKLLGSTERSWTLFVDGYGQDGRRIYDSVRGKTCHQCRQKTLGYRTQCCKCNMVQGQFCGDCLYMRYGEHVLEAIENPDWVCPVCRGICNCSLCRQSKGWAPTGSLYRKISKIGFKSVAHYLIQTNAKASDVKNPDSVDQVSAKRSLFTANALGKLEPNCEDCRNEDGLNRERGEKMNTEANSFPSLPTSIKRSLLFSDSVTGYENQETLEKPESCSKPEPSVSDIPESKRQKQKEETAHDAEEKVGVEVIDVKPTAENVLTATGFGDVESYSKSEPSASDIPESERQEKKEEEIHDAEEKVDVDVIHVKPTADTVLTATGFGDEEIHCTENHDSSHVSSQKKPKRVDIVDGTSVDSIKGRLGRRALQIDQDCVARRLRPRISSK